ncbi:MAG: hypothetical protein KDI79_10955 [Anaerolineae bacterium]|nr:hypothetical protein [Anaerolineae bacterium]
MNQTNPKKSPHQKKGWSVPKLTIYGDVEVITQEYSSGNVVDAIVPIGSPASLSTAPIG